MFIIYHPRATYIRSLARELRQSVMFPHSPERNRRRRGEMDVIVNWGCGTIGQYNRRVLNADISISIHKLRTFDALRGVSIPIPRTVTDPRSILHDSPRPFYQRGKYLARIDGLTGGAGITVYEQGQLPAEGVRADFYSQVVNKAAEVRIHVAGGRIICEQIKHIPAGSHVLIRNWDNGARFSNRSIDSAVGLAAAATGRDIAIRAAAACGLDFGALDMAFTRNGEWCVFEINSAPGITRDGASSTYDAYREYFRGFVRS